MRLLRQGNVLSVYLELSEPGWNNPLLLTSDWHFDSALCQRDHLFRHLDRARALKAKVCGAGDILDLMQGKFDPRRSYKDLRPEYLGDDYYDLVQDDAVKHLESYADSFLFLSVGNHETGYLRANSSNPIARVCRDINLKTGSNIQSMGYGGWVRFMMEWRGVPKGSFSYHYHHGYGGTNAPVTRGTIQTNRQAVIWPDASIIHNGHNHQGYVLPIPRERLSGKGTPYQDIQWSIRTPGYKSALGQPSGFDVEKFPEPTPIGSVLVNFDVLRGKVVIEPTPWVE
jgi:hypothetical protein